jgi:ElaB/YqjD/DUF883 family membrane-anchored ribosome-binding protein
MGQDASTVGAPAHPVSTRAPTPMPEDPALLRAEIERTRLELGETVAALAEKTDVKARAKEKMADVRHNVQASVQEKRTALIGKAREKSPDSTGSTAVQVRDGASSAAVQVRTKAQQNPVPTAAVAAFVGGLLLGRIMKRR